MMPHNNKYYILTILIVFIAVLLFYSNSAPAATCDRSYLGITSTDSEITVCDDYAIGYDYDLKTPLWVAYSVDRNNLKKTVKRKKSFRSDRRLPRKYRVYSSWYVRVGYDRGHMAPAVNFRYSKQSENKAFIMSNVVPQLPGVNRGIWRSLEYRVRKHVKSVGDLVVIDGPIYSKPYQKIKNKLVIPSAFYKILIEQIPYKAIAFIIPNKKPSKGYKLKDYVVSIDYIEKITNIDFLSSMSIPDQIKLESVKSIRPDWPIILK